jgi:hypothetical protein
MNDKETLPENSNPKQDKEEIESLKLCECCGIYPIDPASGGLCVCRYCLSDMEETEKWLSEIDFDYDEGPPDDPCWDCDDMKMPHAARGCNTCPHGCRVICNCDFDKMDDDQIWYHDMYGCKPSFPKRSD